MAERILFFETSEELSYCETGAMKSRFNRPQRPLFLTQLRNNWLYQCIFCSLRYITVNRILFSRSQRLALCTLNHLLMLFLCFNAVVRLFQCGAEYAGLQFLCDRTLLRSLSLPTMIQGIFFFCGRGQYRIRAL